MTFLVRFETSLREFKQKLRKRNKRNKHRHSTYKGYMDAAQINAKGAEFLTQYANGEVSISPPTIADVFTQFPKWGEIELNAL